MLDVSANGALYIIAFKLSSLLNVHSRNSGGDLIHGWFSKLGSLLGSFVIRVRTSLGDLHRNLENYPHGDSKYMECAKLLSSLNPKHPSLYLIPGKLVHWTLMLGMGFGGLPLKSWQGRNAIANFSVF